MCHVISRNEALDVGGAVVFVSDGLGAMALQTLFVPLFAVVRSRDSSAAVASLDLGVRVCADNRVEVAFYRLAAETIVLSASQRRILMRA